MDIVEELPLVICNKMFLRCAVLNYSDHHDIVSSEFWLRGAGWRLRYTKRGPRCSLSLGKWAGVRQPTTLHVSVSLECSENERLVNVLPMEESYTEVMFEDFPWRIVWQKTEQEILGAIPDFRLYGLLNLFVVLTTDSDASQTECSTTSTSTQTTLLMNQLPCLESLSEDLEQLMAEGTHHDVEFRCAGHSIGAHKSIVCKRSPVIASMLAADMVEGRTGVVTIPDMAPDIFAQLMRYMYSGRLGELTFDTALRLYEAGDQYAVLGLAKRCSDYLLEQLSVDNAYELLIVADAHSNRECVDKVVDFMVENNFPSVSEQWLAFCDEHSKLANKVLNRGWKVFSKFVTHEI